jgi:type II secretory pathway component GspD/PulD (secretin)
MNMAKTFKTLIIGLFALLGFSSLAAAQSDRFPAEARFDQPINMDLPADVTLEVYLRELASLVRLQAVTDGIPARAANYPFKNVPFRQAWNLVTSINGLDYDLRPNNVIIVGTPEAVARVRPAQAQGPVAAKPVPVARTYDIKTNPDSIAKFLIAQFPDVKINPVPGTAKLVITAVESQHNEIKGLLVEVDVAAPAPVLTNGDRIVQEIYPLSYAKAGSLANVLKQLVTGAAPTPQGNGVQGTALPGAQAVQPLQGVTIVADEVSNTLIIRGPQGEVATVLAILPKLDRPQQLINVGIRIQEISESASRQLGVNWKDFGIGNFAGSIVDGTLNFLTSATTSLNGLNLSATLNALENQGLSKKVNDSTLTVVNNGTGTIKSGGRVEVSISGGGGQNIQRSFPYGVQIDISPRVSADGSITAEVAAAVSDILGNRENPNPQSINFTEQSFRSTITLKDNQTLLLGSLLQTTQSSTTTGVPVLSAIPLVGDLFKTTRTRDDQTQLIAIVTANVVK